VFCSFRLTEAALDHDRVTDDVQTFRLAVLLPASPVLALEQRRDVVVDLLAGGVRAIREACTAYVGQ